MYEINENGDERRMGMDEKKILVKIKWKMDDREGRFMMRSIDEKKNVKEVGFKEGG